MAKLFPPRPPSPPAFWHGDLVELPNGARLIVDHSTPDEDSDGSFWRYTLTEKMPSPGSIVSDTTTHRESLLKLVRAAVGARPAREGEELLRKALAKRLLIRAIGMLYETPADKRLDIIEVEGDLPGQVRVETAYYDVPSWDEEDR